MVAESFVTNYFTECSNVITIYTVTLRKLRINLFISFMPAKAPDCSCFGLQEMERAWHPPPRLSNLLIYLSSLTCSHKTNAKRPDRLLNSIVHTGLKRRWMMLPILRRTPWAYLPGEHLLPKHSSGCSPCCHGAWNGEGARRPQAHLAPESWNSGRRTVWQSTWWHPQRRKSGEMVRASGRLSMPRVR